MVHAKKMGSARAFAARSVAAALLLAVAAGATVAVAPARAGSLLAVRADPAVVRPGEALTLHGRSGESRDGYRYHRATVAVMRPGVDCPAVVPDVTRDPAVIGSYTGWTIGSEDQPSPARTTLTRPSAVGVARICTYLVVSTPGASGGDAVPGPQTSVRVAADPRGWSMVVAVISPELRVRNGSTVARVTCSAAHHQRCGGPLRLRYRGRTIASGPVAVAPGRDRDVRLRLNPAGRRAVARGRSLRVVVELRPARGVVVKRHLTLRR